MRLRKRIAQVVAVLMMVTWIPVFAASANGVDKVITVKEGATIDTALAPELSIELKDNLAQGRQFYIQLSNAEWEQDVVTQLGVSSEFIFERENKTRLMIEAKRDLLASKTPYKIPLIAKITGGEATVEVISNETVVTSGKYVFAQSEDTKSIVSADDPKVFAIIGEMGQITIEEQYTRAFKSNTAQTVTIELRSRGISFNYSKGHIIPDAVQGKRAYQGKKFDAKIIDATTLEVEIPANSLNETQKGALDFAGIEIKATDNAVYGDVKAIISGDLNDAVELVVARYGDYATELKVADDYKVTAGQPLKDIEFTLGEMVPDSFNGRRETTFTFSKDIEIVNVTIVKSEGLQTGAANPVITIDQKDGTYTNIFKIAGIMADSTKNTKLTFKATLKVPASFNEVINITAEGRSLEDKKEATIAQVQAPIEVDISPITAKVGFAQQEGGKIVLTETAKGQLEPGKIFLAFDDKDIEYTKAPEVIVTEGNIRVDSDAKIIPGGLEVTIDGKSTKPSTIEISGGEFKVNALVADGTRKVKIGGPSISSYSANTLWDATEEKYNAIDEIIEQDFIYLGIKPTSNKAEFVIGQTTYTVNGIKQAMDTAAYLAQEGRTMLPVRYVADALGIPGNQIIWDAATKAVIIIAHQETGLDQVIRIEVGNKTMVINTAEIEMMAAPEIKDNRVFIPVAEIARALGAKVQWDPTTQTATFN